MSIDIASMKLTALDEVDGLDVKECFPDLAGEDRK
jgi:hypothetical protein